MKPPRPVPVRLSWAQVSLAAQVGCWRYLVVLKRGWQERDGEKPDRWEAHIAGALGELVVAQHFGLYWDPGIGFIPRGDVGELEVRTTPATPGHLLLKERDADGARFYLVRGRAPAFELVGSIVGAQGKRPEWWREGARPCFWVPAGVLDEVPR